MTGASRGIGRQVALHLAERGAAVAAVARASGALTGLQEEAARAGGRLRAFAADVTAPAEVESAFAAVDADLGAVSAFAAAKAGVARLTEVLASEVEDSGVRVFGIHPGIVRTPLTERLAWGAEGRAWLPRFGDGVEDRWGDGRPAADLVEAIALGRADALSGRILHVGDDLAELAGRCRVDQDLRRLRLRWDPPAGG